MIDPNPANNVTAFHLFQFQPAPSPEIAEGFRVFPPLAPHAFDDEFPGNESTAVAPTAVGDRISALPPGVATAPGEMPGAVIAPDETSSAVIAPTADGDQLIGFGSSASSGDLPPLCFTDDAWGFLPRLGHDALGLVNWNDAAILGVALGGSLAIRSELDGTVRNWTAEHPDRWGEGSRIIGNFGVAQYQVPVILGAYAYTIYAQDYYQHDMMCSLISAYTLTGLDTLVIKAVADTSRPSDQWNGGKFGFPSYHTASMFSISAVLDEYEGHWIGVPMYAFSGLIGFSRIDTRDHDLSDVVFGAAMGYVIGKSVAGKALYGDSRVHVLPYTHPTDGSPGLMLDANF